jgi:hypothetical protein
VSALIRGFEQRACTSPAAEWMYAAAMVLLSVATQYDRSMLADSCREWAKWNIEFAADVRKRIEFLNGVIARKLKCPSEWTTYRALGLLEIRCALALRVCLEYALDLRG